MKKCILFLMLLSCLCGCNPNNPNNPSNPSISPSQSDEPIFPDFEPQEEVTYADLDDKYFFYDEQHHGYEIMLTTNLTGAIRVPATYKGLPISNFTFKRSNITDVFISEGIETIDQYAFYECAQLRSVVLPDSIHTIGTGAFSKCTSIKWFNFPDSIKSIGPGAFYSCKNIVTSYHGCVYLGDKDNPFFYLRRITGYYTNLDKITDIVVHDGCRIVGCNTSDSPSLSVTSIYLPDGVVGISPLAFSKMESLKSIRIPDSLETIGGYAFDETGLKFNKYGHCSYIGPESNPYKFLIKANERPSPAFTIHSDCRFISSAAFSYCNEVTSITIPKSVEYIDESAFSLAEKLNSITFEEGSTIKYIGTYAFQYTKIETLTIPDSLERLADYPFNACYQLKTVIVKSEKVAINGCLLSFDSNCYPIICFEKPYIPNNWVNVNEQFIFGYIGTTVYDNYRFVLGEYDGKKVSSLIEIINPTETFEIDFDSVDGYQIISATPHLFMTISTFKKITVPSFYGNTLKYTFSGCSNLEEIVFSDNIERFEKNTFMGCPKLKHIALPDSVNYVDADAFDYSSIEFETIGSLCYVGTSSNKYKFLIKNNDPRINSGTAHVDCEYLAAHAFYETDFSIGLSNIKYILDHSLCVDNYYYTKWTNYIIIPSSVRYIGRCAFNSDDNYITYEGTKAEWELIEKDQLWLERAKVLTVKCSDGNIVYCQ